MSSIPSAGSSALGLMLLVLAAALAVLRGPLPATLARAFAPLPAPRLGPDEHVVMALRPDPGVMGLLGLILCVGLVAFQTGMSVMGADPAQALWVCAVPFAAVTAAFVLECRKGWVITNRRVITRAGGSLDVATIRRLHLGPGLLRIDADGDRGLAMLGLRDPRGVATLLQGMATRHSR